MNNFITRRLYRGKFIYLKNNTRIRDKEIIDYLNKMSSTSCGLMLKLHSIKKLKKLPLELMQLRTQAIYNKCFIQKNKK